jgi:glycosyltransferase involved in cell wall biosynthesis
MESHAADLAGEYAARGLPVLAVVPRGVAFDGLAGRFGSAGAKTLRLTTDARDGRQRQLGGIATLARELRRFRPTIVHVHTGGATGGLAPVLAARAATHATVGITEHDVPGESCPRSQRMARALLDRASHAVIAVSRRNAGLRQARLPVRSASFAVVLNGVPLKLPPGRRHDVRGQLGIGDDDVVIGSLARLAEGKGLDTLLNAFARVREGRACKLLLVGDGPLRKELETLATELAIAADVIFAGQQPEPARYLEAMDAFCLAVPAGSMSIALLEAMSLGLPPVITFGGPEEAVIHGETGLLAKPSDAASLAEAMARLVDDVELRARLALAAESHVFRHYSTARVADDLLEVFASARAGSLTPRLRADAPPDPRPGDRTLASSPRGPETARVSAGIAGT